MRSNSCVRDIELIDSFASMLEIRVHGRGGQGAVIASKILASAFFKENKYVQAFPYFGAERQGAPVMAFVRVDDEEIDLRCQIYNPTHLIVLDYSLPLDVDLTVGLQENATILINSTQSPESYQYPPHLNVFTVDANTIAAGHKLGTPLLPIVNSAIIGAFARITGLVKIESVTEAIIETVPVKQEENAMAAQETYQITDKILHSKVH